MKIYFTQIYIWTVWKHVDFNVELFPFKTNVSRPIFENFLFLEPEPEPVSEPRVRSRLRFRFGRGKITAPAVPVQTAAS
jgi:hypothetical protein